MQNKFSKLMLLIVLNNNIMAVVPSITITSPANGSTITNHQPVVSGTVFPNIGVNLTIDGILSQEGNRQTPNKWKIKSSTVLPNGTHKAVATVTTIDGKTATAKSTFTISPAPSHAITITSPKNGSIVNAPLLITGKAQPGSKLIIQLQSEKTCKIVTGNLVVNQSGFWSFRFVNQTLGLNLLVVNAIAPDGVSSVARSLFTLVASTSGGSNSGCCN